MQKADCISLFKPRRSKFAFLQPLTKKNYAGKKSSNWNQATDSKFSWRKKLQIFIRAKSFPQKNGLPSFFPIKFFFSLTRLPKFGSTSAFFVQQIKKLFRFYFSFSLHKKILSKPLNNFWPISFGDNWKELDAGKKTKSGQKGGTMKKDLKCKA